LIIEDLFIGKCAGRKRCPLAFGDGKASKSFPVRGRMPIADPKASSGSIAQLPLTNSQLPEI
jgi:hypothetical protein